MHLYAKDLDDLRSLVTSRKTEEIRTSIFVWTLRQAWGQCHQDHAESANIGHCYTPVSRRVEKQRMFESFIMENLLTATKLGYFPL